MNGLVRASEPASPLFRFRFQNIFLGPLCYRDFEEIGPWRGKDSNYQSPDRHI